MAQSVNLPGGEHQLAFITGLEKAFLRNKGPYADELQGELPKLNGIEVFRNPGEAGGGTGMGGGGDGDATIGTGRAGSIGVGATGVGTYGSHNMSANPRDIRSARGMAWAGKPRGNPGDDPRSSEGGGEVIRAATGSTTTNGTGTETGTENGSGGSQDTGGGGLSDAEIMAERINDALNAINGLFAGRQGVYDKLRDSSYALSQSGIADAYQRASRKLGFQMLRQGQDTGQVDIDLRSDLSKLKNDSLADAMRHAQGLSEGLRTKDSAKRAGLNSQALTGMLDPGQVGGMAGTLSAGVPQSWGGIADIGWNIPSGFAPGGGGGFMPNWKDMGNATPYFGASS